MNRRALDKGLRTQQVTVLDFLSGGRQTHPDSLSEGKKAGLSVDGILGKGYDCFTHNLSTVERHEFVYLEMISQKRQKMSPIL